LNTTNVTRHDFKGPEQALKINSRRCVLVPDSDDCLPLGPRVIYKFEAVPYQTGIPFVGMKKIDRPVLSRLVIVPEGSHDLAFDRPFAREQQIWRSLRANGPVAVQPLIQVCSYDFDELRFSVWANSRLKILTRYPASVDENQCIRNALDDGR
jgi:hypothetical protein